MTATIRIEMDNAAFEDTPMLELGRILRELARSVETLGRDTETRLRDVNGNTVGEFSVQG
jgi:hypothetical protein